MRYELVWEMNRKLAKRLVRKQFFRYRFLKYVTGWTLLIEGILMCCLPLKFSFLSCCVYLVCFFWIAICIYVLHCCAMYPKSGFLAQYRAEFYDRFFIVSGKNYQRKYAYKDVDKCILRKGDIFFLTREEGVVLPESVWKSTLERETFWEFVRKAKSK